MLSEIKITGLNDFSSRLNSIRKKLNNPEKELKTTADYIRKIIQTRFDEQKNPLGQPWKPSKRVLREGGKTLTLSGELRNGLKPKITSGGGKFKIEFVPSAQSKEYAYIHNNGGKFRNRSGRFTTMPKRQYAFLTETEKQTIIRYIWIKSLLQK